MTSGATEPRSRQRLFITMAVSRYRHLPEDAQLGNPSADAERISDLLSAFGYQQALRGMGNYWTAEHVRSSLSGWSKDAGLGPDDVLIFYFAGHGVVEDRDRHYLLCWDSVEDDPAATALATEDLVRLLTRTGLRNLLIVLDTCYGGAGAADGAQLVLRTITRQLNVAGSGGVWLLSSARAKDEAVDGAFVDALLSAVKEVSGRTGQRQRYLDLADVVDALNRRFQHRNLRQRAELAAGLVTGLAPFLDNEGYHHNLPGEDTDLELQRFLVQRDLYDHFGPRSRGVEWDFELGLYFQGRERLLEELTGWLTAEDSDGTGRVVTGSPGCGKSAVLGRIVAMSDPVYRQILFRETAPPGSGIPPKLVDVAVHARHKLLPTIVEQIASELNLVVDGPGQLLREVSLRARQDKRIVIVLDALDEAGSGTAADSGGKGEPRRIARELVRPLSEMPGVRLLVGTRRELIGSLGTSMQVLDLDDPAYLGNNDIACYVAKVLLAENEPERPTPYRDRPELARLMGEAVAARAAGVFLVARITARSLRSADTPVDVSKADWQDELPREIGEAFEDYLSRFGSDENRVRELLTPLAFAEGQGLPRGQLWTGISSALSGREFSEEDVDWLLEKASSYVAEVTEHGWSVYRLYHQALAEHLRARYRFGAQVAQERIVDALLATLPHTANNERDWFSGHRYVRAYLATHAAAASRLDQLAGDPAFLLVAEQLALLRAFPRVNSESARRARNAYEQVAHQLVGSAPIGERTAYLQLSARRCDAGVLADRINELGIPMPWCARWAWWSPTGVHRQLVGHQWSVNSLAAGDMDGRPVALTGSWGTVRIWDLLTRRPLGEPLQHGNTWVSALVIGELSDYSIAVMGDDDGELRVWDLSTGRPLGNPLVGHTNAINSIALIHRADRLVGVSASEDGTARVWDLESGAPLGEPFIGHRNPVRAVAIAELDEQIVVLTGGADKRVRLWDIDSREPVGDPLIGHTGAVIAVALARIDGHKVVVTGSEDGSLGLWDLRSRQQVGEPLAAHSFNEGGVCSVATGELNGVPVAVSCSRERARVWNLATRQPIGQPLAGHDESITAVVLGSVERRPVAITGGTDRTARIWDLSADQPLSGHTDSVKCVTMGRIKQRCLALTGSTDTTAVLWDLDDGGGKQDGLPLAGHRETVSAVALDELGDRAIAVTGSEDATVRIWDLNTRRPIGPPIVGHTGPITAVGLYRVNGMPVLATGSTDGTVRLWDPHSGSAMCAPLTGHNAKVDLLTVSEVGGRTIAVAATTHRDVTVWDLRAHQLIDIEDPGRGWQALAVGEVDNRVTVLLARDDNTLLLWDLLAGRVVGELMKGHTDRLFRAVLAYREDRPIALTSSMDMTVRAWDLRTSRLLGEPLVGEGFPGLALAVGPLRSGTAAIITAGHNQTRLWSLTTFQQLGDALIGCKTDTQTVTFGSVVDRTLVVSGGLDGAVRVRDFANGELVGPVLSSGGYHSVYGLAVSDLDGPVVVTADRFSRSIRVWDLVTRRERYRWAHTELIDGLVVGCRQGRPVIITTAVSNVQVWDPSARSMIKELAGHTARIGSLSTTEFDGQSILITGSCDSTARLWDLNTLEPLGPSLTGHLDSVNAVAMSAADGRLTAFTGDDDGVVRVWDVATVTELGYPIPQMQKRVSALAAGELHGRPILIIGSGDGTIRLWCRTTKEVVAELQLNSTPQDVAIHPDGDLCVATSMGIVTVHVRDWINERDR